MSKIIAIANQKGGVGKTTTAFNIAAGMAKKNKRVLIVDLDSQGNLSSYAGYDPAVMKSATIADLIFQVADNIPIEEIDIKTAIIENESENVEYIPSNIALASADLKLVNIMCREQILRKILRSPQLSEYEYIVIDCSPAVGLLLINAFVASDSIIIPVQAQKFALDGMDYLLDVYKEVQMNINRDLTIEGFVITMYDNTLMAMAVEEALRDSYPELVYKQRLHRYKDAANSTFAQQSIISMKNSKLGEQYSRLVQEILNRQKQEDFINGNTEYKIQ